MRPSYIALPLVLSLACGLVRAQDTNVTNQRQIELTPQERNQLGQQEFWKGRSTPGADPYSLRLQALEQAKGMAELAHPDASPSAPTWTSIGPNVVNFFGIPSSGANSGMAVDSGNPQTIYSAFAGGGVWKTTNGGSSWSPLTDQQAFVDSLSFAMDPNDPKTIYLGAAGGYGGGILKSSDGGGTWTDIKAPFVGPFGADNIFGGSARINNIAVQPGNSRVVLTDVFLGNSSTAGLYRSSDGGTTWSLVLPGLIGNGLVFDSQTPSNAYAALCQGSGPGGIYKSTDGGLTWAILTGGLPSPSVVANFFCTVNISPSNPSTLVAGFNVVGGSQIFTTSDGGKTWAQTTSPPDAPHSSLFFSPVNPNVLFAPSADIYRSLDAGKTWTSIGYYAHGVHPDVNASSFVGKTNEMYLGTDGGVFHTSDASAPSIEWTNLNGTMATLRVYPGMSLHPTDPTIVLGGTQDEGTIRYSGNPNWIAVGGCGDSASTAIDQVNPLQVYADCYYATVERSTDGGQTFSAGATGINTSDTMNFFPPLVTDPSNGSNVYFGTTHVYQSTNAAQSWTSISPNFNPLYSIAVSPKSSNTVYAAEATAVWVSTNASAGTGATWVKGNSGLPGRQITQVMADLNSSTTAYVTVSGFTGFGDSLGHVFKTTNGGSTWQDISGNLPNIPADAIAIDPDLANNLYLATDTGVFASSDGGQTWLPYGTGLPNVITTGIVFFRPSRLLRVSTFGRGFWSISAPATSVSASPSSLSFGNQAVNTSSAAMAITVTNNLVSSPFSINSISANGNFSQTNTCGSTLLASSSCTISVVFSPVSVASLSGTVSINTDHGTAAIPVSGTGVGAPLATLSTNSLAFANQPVGISSAPQTVTITNGGTASLSNITLSITGTNSSYFTQTSTCASSLAVGANCSVSVVFNASAVGNPSASLSISDNAANSPQTVALTGSAVPAFSLSTTTSSSTISAGKAASYTLSFVSATGYPLVGTAQLNCANLPTLTTCSFSPASIATGSTTQSITVTVQTTAATASLAYPPSLFSPSAKAAIGICGLVWIGIFSTKRRLAFKLLVMLVGLLVIGFSGCGGSTGSQHTGTPGTPAGTYTINVTAQSSAYQATQSLTLIVQ